MNKLVSDYPEGLYCKDKKGRCPLEVFSIKADEEGKHAMRHYFTTIVSERDVLITELQEENDVISDMLKKAKQESLGFQVDLENEKEKHRNMHDNDN